MPKGFLPIQDTGLITAVTEAGPEVSFAEMQRLQQSIVAAVRADPDVTGVVSVVGVTPINRDAECGPPRHHAQAARRAAPASSPPSSTGSSARSPRSPAWWSTSSRSRTSRSAPAPAARCFNTRLTGTDATQVATWANRLVERMRADTLLRDVASEAQDGGLRADIKVDREKAGRLGISMQSISDTLDDAFGQRQISTIFGQANQYRVILEAMPEYQRDPSTLTKLYLPARIDHQSSHPVECDLEPADPADGVDQSGAAERGRGARAHHGAARHHARGAVSRGHPELQPGARRLARRGGRRHLRCGSRHRHADHR